MKYLIESDERRDIQIFGLNFQKKNKNSILIFKKYYEDICMEKEKIDKLENGYEWDRIKKIGNPFELIYTSTNKKKKKDSISNYQPISRSYFKMWEIFFNFSDKIFKDVSGHESLSFGNLAEGPGGFMEAIHNYRNIMLRGKQSKDVYYGITLQPNNEYVPDWNKMKKIFGDKQNIHIDYGNLYLYNDVIKYVRNFQNKKAFIVTADGGFDYSSDFNGQEISSCQIIYSECVVALNILKEKGTFVCKVFDLFTSTMIKIIYLLYMNFEEVYFYKPETSRPANSEKYLVCIGYKNVLSNDEKNYLLHLIREYQNGVVSQDIQENETYDLNGIRVPNSFVRSLSLYNEEYIKNQKYYLQKTIQLAYQKPNKEEYDLLIKNQVKNAIDWCKKYNVPINQQSIYLTKN